MDNNPAGCAVGSDGALLSPSKISWYNDVDDEIPIPSIPSAAASQPSYLLFTSEPARVVAGSRHSERRKNPSHKLKDPNNIAVPETVTSRKRARETEDNGTSVAKASKNLKKVYCEAAINDNKESVEEDAEVPEHSLDEKNEDAEMTQSEDEDAEAEYQRTKALGDRDRETMQMRLKDDRTADIRTVFTADETTNPHTGKLEKGQWCTICKKNQLGWRAFFTGNTTTCRNHIARKRGHFEIYKKHCEEAVIPIHPRAIPKGGAGLDGSKQSSLDGLVTRTKRVQYSRDGLMDHIIELVVTDDSALRLVDKPAFRQLLMFLRPDASEKDIPHHTKLRKEIMKRSAEVEAIVANILKNTPGEISLTIDTWTSGSGTPYMSVTAHYIYSPVDAPQDWTLCSEQLAFTKIEGNHSGANQAKILAGVTDRYGIREKAGWITSDNITSNDTAMMEFGNIIDPEKEQWDPIERRIHCMEHAVHLGAKHVVDEISPTSSAKVLKKVRDVMQKTGIDMEDNVDLDELDSALEACLDYGNDSDDNEDFSPGDTLGKVLVLITQIRKSPQAQAFFKKQAQEAQVPVRQLLTWVRTRWASLYHCLDRAFELQLAINRFVLLADESFEVPVLKDKQYSDFRLSKIEWGYLEKIHAILKEPATATQTFSSAKYPTLFQAIPTLEFLLTSWSSMTATSRFSDMYEALVAGLENLTKWYHEIDDSDAYFICLALDPNYKTSYAEAAWDVEDFEKAMTRLEDVFDRYSSTSNGASSIVHSDITPAQMGTYGQACMLEKIQKAQKKKKKASAEPRAELQRYLDDDLTRGITDVVSWWGKHVDTYPVLAKIARDYLPIQASAVASERAFSGGGLTDTKHRNRLLPTIFEALQILKSGYRNGHIKASEQAASRIKAALDKIEAQNTDEDSDNISY